jgi:uncharacterized membrane protein (UPF0127 family)
VARLTVQVADTPALRRMGLMHRSSMPDDFGMLFVFGYPQTLSFWMQDTRIALSIAFIDENWRIVQMDDLEPLSTESVVCPDATFALEVNQGWFVRNNVRVGDQVVWDVRTTVDIISPKTADFEVCTRCGKPIKGLEHWLEYDQRTWEFVPEGTEVPPELSQGGYPFGPECFKKPNEPYEKRGVAETGGYGKGYDTTPIEVLGAKTAEVSQEAFDKARYNWDMGWYDIEANPSGEHYKTLNDAWYERKERTGITLYRGIDPMGYPQWANDELWEYNGDYDDEYSPDLKREFESVLGQGKVYHNRFLDSWSESKDAAARFGGGSILLVLEGQKEALRFPVRANEHEWLVGGDCVVTRVEYSNMSDRNALASITVYCRQTNTRLASINKWLAKVKVTDVHNGPYGVVTYRTVTVECDTLMDVDRKMRSMMSDKYGDEDVSYEIVELKPVTEGETAALKQASRKTAENAYWFWIEDGVAYGYPEENVHNWQIQRAKDAYSHCVRKLPRKLSEYLASVTLSFEVNLKKEYDTENSPPLRGDSQMGGVNIILGRNPVSMEVLAGVIAHELWHSYAMTTGFWKNQDEIEVFLNHFNLLNEYTEHLPLLVMLRWGGDAQVDQMNEQMADALAKLMNGQNVMSDYFGDITHPFLERYLYEKMAQEGEWLYHNTPTANIASILEHGLQATDNPWYAGMGHWRLYTFTHQTDLFGNATVRFRRSDVPSWVDAEYESFGSEQGACCLLATQPFVIPASALEVVSRKTAAIKKDDVYEEKWPTARTIRIDTNVFSSAMVYREDATPIILIDQTDDKASCLLMRPKDSIPSGAASSSVLSAWSNCLAAYRKVYERVPSTIANMMKMGEDTDGRFGVDVAFVLNAEDSTSTNCTGRQVTVFVTGAQSTDMIVLPSPRTVARLQPSR